VLAPTLHHKRLTPLGVEKDSNNADDMILVCSNKSSSNSATFSRRMPTIDPKDLNDRTFQKEREADGQQFRAQIVCTIVEKMLS
jgi:hypothetical protein